MGGGISTGKVPVLCEGEEAHNRGLEGARDLILQPEMGVRVQPPASESCCQLCLCTMGVSVFPRSPALPSRQSHVCSAAATAGTAAAPSSLAGGSM